MNKFAKNLLLLLGLSVATVFCWKQWNAASDKAIWGEKIEFSAADNKVVQSHVMQRLKDIDQSGPAHYMAVKIPAFSRYEHSVGVFALLKKVGVSKKEQIAGLLHDASHTVFSHVGDYIWAKDINDYADESFQNSIHLKYLHDNKLEDVLELLDMSLQDMDVENGQYRALEQPLPDMCADRIQYNIHTGVILGKLSRAEAQDIASDLHFEDRRWFFTNHQIAKKFAEISLYCTQNFWGARWNTSMNIHFSNALKRAVDLKLLTMKDIFTTDAEVLKKVMESDDEVIKLNLQQCEQPVSRIPGKSYKTEFFKPKFRGVNPLVKDKSGKLRRLTELDPMFRNYYESVKKWCDEGFEIDILQL